MSHALRKQEDSSGDDHYVQNWKPVHDRIVALHLAGYKNTNIAAILGVSEPHVSRVLNDPRAQKAIRKLQKRIFSTFTGRIEDKMLALGEGAIDNIRETIDADLSDASPGSKAKKHQDSISFELLDRIGFGKKQAGKKEGSNIQLSEEASERLVDALEKSDKAREMWEQDEDGEWVRADEDDE